MLLCIEELKEFDEGQYGVIIADANDDWNTKYLLAISDKTIYNSLYEMMFFAIPDDIVESMQLLCYPLDDLNNNKNIVPTITGNIFKYFEISNLFD